MLGKYITCYGDFENHIGNNYTVVYYGLPFVKP